jgi:hypothetical protein
VQRAEATRDVEDTDAAAADLDDEALAGPQVVRAADDVLRHRLASALMRSDGPVAGRELVQRARIPVEHLIAPVARDPHERRVVEVPVGIVRGEQEHVLWTALDDIPDGEHGSPAVLTGPCSPMIAS